MLAYILLISALRSTRVDRGRLLRKLRRSGPSNALLRFFADYFDVRRAVVIEQGMSSNEMGLSDMVFQGTVLGPY